MSKNNIAEVEYADGTCSSNLDPVLAQVRLELRAERDRADRAEARVAQAWREGVRHATGKISPDVSGNPYRPEATA